MTITNFTMDSSFPSATATSLTFTSCLSRNGSRSPRTSMCWMRAKTRTEVCACSCWLASIKHTMFLELLSFRDITQCTNSLKRAKLVLGSYPTTFQGSRSSKMAPIRNICSNLTRRASTLCQQRKLRRKAGSGCT